MSGTIASLLASLQSASWRGIDFHVPTARDGAGRRVLPFLFPGLDQRAHQDLGAMDGPVTVQGLIVGSDYVERAMLLREAFREAGPGTLVHPWYGEQTLILVDQPEIEFDQRRLRVAYFTATFDHWRELPSPATDTLGSLRLAVASVRARIRTLLARVLAPVRLAYGVVSGIAAFGGWLRGDLSLLVGGLTNGGALLGVLEPALDALTALGSAAGDSAYAAIVADALDAPFIAISGTAEPAPKPAIAAGGDIATDSSIMLDPVQVATALVVVAGWTAPSSIVVPAAVQLAAQADALGGAVEAAAQIPFASQQDARAWHAALDTTIADRMAAAVASAGDAPAEIAAVYQALADLRVAVARDMSVEIGRLPAVRSITVPGDCTLWQVANHLAGDQVALIQPIFADLMTRNRIRRAGAVRAGTVLEYLA
ncbi:DNA circularization N-terminal domain-containing protein [Roseomonas sp. HJA6]|uniref:DNA circularization N-terminal domain-containing protein n=1 Tax=Roseomonas alba TaxID=2846776 RepID=A0ABS7AI89_9PROT|nr:DNA circularization N-terminal domain-containing protein [Neoroseomonas alba]MBW6402029.1 DNA circularization N-terminal domain-containing protein [Neoroseomonas alba]